MHPPEPPSTNHDPDRSCCEPSLVKNLRESARTPPEARGLLSDTIERGTLSKNRKKCLHLINTKAKRQPRGPRQILRFARGPRRKASDELPTLRLARDPSLEAPPERPRARYRFFVSLEAGSASVPP